MAGALAGVANKGAVLRGGASIVVTGATGVGAYVASATKRGEG